MCFVLQQPHRLSRLTDTHFFLHLKNIQRRSSRRRRRRMWKVFFFLLMLSSLSAFLLTIGRWRAMCNLQFFYVIRNYTSPASLHLLDLMGLHWSFVIICGEAVALKNKFFFPQIIISQVSRISSVLLSNFIRILLKCYMKSQQVLEFDRRTASSEPSKQRQRETCKFTMLNRNCFRVVWQFVFFQLACERIL